MIICLTAAILPSQTINVAIPLIRADWRLDYSAAGLLVAAYQGGYVLGAALALVQERANLRLVVLFGTILAALGSLALLPVQGMTGAMVVRALAGAGMGWVYMPGLLLLSRHFPVGARGAPTGFYVAAFSIGQSFSMALTGWLLPFLHWRMVAVLVGACSLIGTTALLLTWRTVAPPPDTNETTAPVPPSAGNAAGRATFAMLLPVFLVMFSYTVHSWELYAVRSWLPAFMTEQLTWVGWETNLATATSANVVAVVALIGALMTASGGVMADRFGAMRTAATLLIISGISTALLGWTHHGHLLGVAVVMLVSSLTLNADSPIYSAAMTEWSPARIKGKLMAIYTVFGFTAATLAPIVVGRGLDTWGWGPTYTLVALPNLIALAAVLHLLRLQRLRQRQAAPAQR